MGGAEWTVFIRAASSDGRVATASILIPEKRKASIVVALVRGNTSPMSGGSMQSDRRILAQEQLLEEDVRKLLALAM